MLTTKRKFILFAIIIAVLLSLNDSFELPFLQTCTFEDEQCHIQQVDKFFEMYAEGIEELHVPTFDPMYLGNITIKGNPNQNFNLKLFMENVILHKFPQVKCLSIKGFTKDISKPTSMVMKMFSPHLIMKAHCRINSKLLLFAVDGETDLRVDIKNVTTTMKSKCTPYTRDGLTYFKVEDMTSSLNIGSLSTSFANSTLFNGEDIFMESFADTINNNWDILREEMEPHINNAIGRISLDAINKILPTIPHNKYFKGLE